MVGDTYRVTETEIGNFLQLSQLYLYITYKYMLN